MFLRHIFSAVSLCLSLPFHTFAAVHERLAVVPAGWTQVGAPPQNDTLVLQIALVQQNLEELDARILAISTPGSASYGQHMDRDAVAALLAPSADASPAILAWLEGAGITNIFSDGATIIFSTTVNTANTLLSTTFNYYENDGVQKLRTTEYSVPDDLQTHIDLITPTTYFGKTVPQMTRPNIDRRARRLVPRYIHQVNGTTNSTIPSPTNSSVPYPTSSAPGPTSSTTKTTVDASCATLITPTCLKELYNIHYTADPNSGSKIGFGSFLNQSARTEDLSIFQEAQGIPQQGFAVELINGGVDDQAIDNNHGEADLDIEYISGISSPLPIIGYITGGSPPFVPNLDEPTSADNTNEPYLNYYQYLLSLPNSELPNVITNSYGDEEQTVPEKYATRVCSMIGQLGLRGISVIESSGDTGLCTFSDAADSDADHPLMYLPGVGAPCQSNDGKKTPQFTPQFPATCPYITAVGGTQSISPEIAWTASSGGFSNYFSQPDYQAGAVSTYLNNYITPATKEYFSAFTNFSNRGFPDVSAHSVAPDYAIVVNGVPELSGGTSAAAPVFASVIALLNDARFRAGKPALGFLNPWLYAVGFTALTDITGGQSVGCNGINGQTGLPVPAGSSIIPFASWNATSGWDPVTGLGVPNFEKLLGLALSL